MQAVTMPKSTKTRRRREDGNALERATRELQRVMLRAALESCGWSVTGAAKALGMVGPEGQPQPASVLRKIADLGMRDEYESNRPATPARK